MIDRIATLGEGLAIFRADEGEPLWHRETVHVATGGAEANVAMSVARLGIPVTWLGRVGDDALGRRIVRELRGEGVDVHAIVDPDAPTGLLVKELHAGGRTRVSYYRGGSAGSRLTVADADLLELTRSTLVHLTGITPGLSAGAHGAVERVLQRARELGAAVSFDVNHRSRLWDAAAASSVYRAIAQRADIVFTSVDEVPLLAPYWNGGDADDAAAALAALGHRHVVVTAGARGAVAHIDGEVSAVAAVPVRVVDTVGAGDAFVGGYLAGWASGQDATERLELAALLGAAACRHPGDWEGAADLDGLGGLDEGDDPVLR